MTELTVINNNEQQAISARELYKGLEITDRFNRWFESLLKYGFVENEDFTSVKSSTLVNNGAKREIDDYIISLDMAKQICMIQRSEQGKEYRSYLIRLEKAWNTPEAVMARALQVANRTLENANKQIAEMKPKAIVYDNLVERNKLLNFRDMASRLGIPQTEFMKILKSKYIYKNSVGEYRAYAEFQHLFALRIYNKSTDRTGEQLLLSMEGITYFLNKYKGEQNGSKN